MNALSRRATRLRSANYVAAAECTLAFARPLATGWMTSGEVERRVLRLLIAPEWRNVERGRDVATGLIKAAVTTSQVTR